MKIPKLNLNLKIEKPFGNLLRQETVLIAAISGKHVLLGGKSNYPEGIYRFIGGGVENDRDGSVEEAAINELAEEIGYTAQPGELAYIGKVDIKATDMKSRQYRHLVHLFSLNLPTSFVAKPTSDINTLKYYCRKDLITLVSRYNELGANCKEKKNVDFQWNDYGKMYGPIHQFFLDISSDLIK